MPPSGFSNTTAQSLADFSKGCHSDLQSEVEQGKHKNFEDGQKFEVHQIGKALLTTEDEFDHAVLRLVQVIYDQKLSPKDVLEKTARLHITPEGKLVHK